MDDTGSISTGQNGGWSIQLLAAQRQLYSEAKTIRKIRTWVGTSLGLVGLFVGTVCTQILPVVGTIGAFLVIADRICAWVEKRRSTSAANIQEQFDSKVFSLPWNELTVGLAVDPEDVNCAAARFRGDRHTLLDWYPSTDGIPFPANVFVCQRANIVWDSRLRKGYAYLVMFSRRRW